MFDQAEERLIRLRLATMLRWVVSQRLLPKLGGGRVAAIGIMRQALRVQDTVVHGESEGKTFYEIIEAGVAQGMQTFDASIIEAYEKGLISEETAIAYASSRSVVFRGIDRIKNARGEKTTDLEGLEVDLNYERRMKKSRS